ncbi:MAG: hypothetical protein KJP06_04405, partial [Deltaproteobacteria bacterium]|nr:hypothetical protein [Deltaproteobacteria bacterium]
YKIPVVWPANDWYVADKSKPITPERRSRIRRSGRKRSQHQASRRTQAPAASTKARARSHPGALFGFGPKSPKGTDAKKPGDSEAPTPKKQARRKKKGDSEASTPKKQARRKKKSPSRAAKKPKSAKPASQR